MHSASTTVTFHTVRAFDAVNGCFAGKVAGNPVTMAVCSLAVSGLNGTIAKFGLQSYAFEVEDEFDGGRDAQEGIQAICETVGHLGADRAFDCHVAIVADSVSKVDESSGTTVFPNFDPDSSLLPYSTFDVGIRDKRSSRHSRALRLDDWHFCAVALDVPLCCEQFFSLVGASGRLGDLFGMDLRSLCQLAVEHACGLDWAVASDIALALWTRRKVGWLVAAWQFDCL